MKSRDLLRTFCSLILCFSQIIPEHFLFAADDPPDPNDIEYIGADPSEITKSVPFDRIPNEGVAGGFPQGGVQFMKKGSHRFIIDPGNGKIYTDYPPGSDKIHIDIATEHGVISENNVGRGYVRGFFEFVNGEWVMTLDPQEALTDPADISKWTSRSFIEEYFNKLTSDPNARLLHGVRIKVLAAPQLPTNGNFIFDARRGFIDRARQSPPPGAVGSDAQAEAERLDLDEFIKELEEEKTNPPKEDLEEPKASELELKEPDAGDSDKKLYETAKEGRVETTEEKYPDFKDLNRSEVLPTDEESLPGIEKVGEEKNKSVADKVDESLKSSESVSPLKESIKVKIADRIVKMKFEAAKVFKKVIRRQGIKVRKTIIRGRRFTSFKFKEYKESFEGIKDAPVHHIGLVILGLWDIAYAYYEEGFWEGSMKAISFVGFWILFHEVFKGIGTFFGEAVAAGLGEVLALFTWFVVIGRFAEEQLIWSSIDDLYLKEFYTGEKGFKNPLGVATELKVGFLGAYQMDNSPVKGLTRENFYLKFTDIDKLRGALAQHIRNLMNDDVIGPVLPPHAKDKKLWGKIVHQAEKDWKTGWAQEVKKMKEAWEKERQEELSLEEQEMAAAEDTSEKLGPEVQTLGYKINPEKPMAEETVSFVCQYAVYGLPGDKVTAKESFKNSSDKSGKEISPQEKQMEFDVGEVAKIMTSEFSIPAGKEGKQNAEWKVELNTGASASIPVSWEIAPESGTIVVNVTDAETSEPISGAEIILDAEGAQTTGGNGSISFERVEAGTHSVHASAAFYESRTGMAEIKGKDTQTLAFKLKPGAVKVTVKGRVVRASDRNGIDGALITAEGASSQLTNASGEYSVPIPGLKPKETIFIKAEHEDGGKTFSGNASVLYPGKTDSVSAPDIVLKIAKDAQISGSVLDINNEGLAGVSIEVEKGETISSGGDGSFSTVLKEISIGETVTLKAVYQAADGQSYASDSVVVKFEGQPVTGIVLKVPYQEFYKDVSVSGKVMDLDSLGVSGASVTVNGIQTTADSDGNYEIQIPKIKMKEMVSVSAETAGPAGPVSAQNQREFQGNPIQGLEIFIPIARIFPEVQIWGVVYNTTGAEINFATVTSDHGGSSGTNVSGQFSLTAANLRKGDSVTLVAEQVIEGNSERTTYAGSTQVTFQGTEIGNVRIVLADQPSKTEPIVTPEDAVEIAISSLTVARPVVHPGENLDVTLVYNISGLPQDKSLHLDGFINPSPVEQIAISGEVSNGPYTKSTSLKVPENAQAGQYSVSAELKAGNKSTQYSAGFEIKPKANPEDVQLSIASLSASPANVQPGQSFDVTLMYVISGLAENATVSLTGSLTAGNFGQDPIGGEAWNGQWTKVARFTVPNDALNGSYQISAQLQAGTKSAQQSATVVVEKTPVPEETEPPETEAPQTAPPKSETPETGGSTAEGTSFCVQLQLNLPKGPVAAPKHVEGEATEAFQARMKAFLDSLTLNNVTFVPSEHPMVLCVGESALNSFPRDGFTSGSKFAMPFNAIQTGEGMPNMSGAILLTTVNTYDTYEQAIASNPKLNSQQNKPVILQDPSGAFSTQDEKGSASGRLEAGWSAENKQKALDFYKQFLFLLDCFVATAAYQNPDAPQIKILRGFRDTVLFSSKSGRHLIQLYYRYGPALADKVIQHPSIIPVVRKSLNVFVQWIESHDMNDTGTRFVILRPIIFIVDQIASAFLKDTARDPSQDKYFRLFSILFNRFNKDSDMNTKKVGTE